MAATEDRGCLTNAQIREQLGRLDERIKGERERADAIRDQQDLALRNAKEEADRHFERLNEHREEMRSFQRDAISREVFDGLERRVTATEGNYRELAGKDTKTIAIASIVAALISAGIARWVG